MHALILLVVYVSHGPLGTEKQTQLRLHKTMQMDLLRPHLLDLAFPSRVNSI